MGGKAFYMTDGSLRTPAEIHHDRVTASGNDFYTFLVDSASEGSRCGGAVARSFVCHLGNIADEILDRGWGSKLEL